MAFYKLWIPNENISLIYLLTIIGNMTTIPGGPMQPLYYIYILTLKKRNFTNCNGSINTFSSIFFHKITPLQICFKKCFHTFCCRYFVISIY